MQVVQGLKFEIVGRPCGEKENKSKYKVRYKSESFLECRWKERWSLRFIWSIVNLPLTPTAWHAWGDVLGIQTWRLWTCFHSRGSSSLVILRQCSAFSYLLRELHGPCLSHGWRSLNTSTFSRFSVFCARNNPDSSTCSGSLEFPPAWKEKTAFPVHVSGDISGIFPAFETSFTHEVMGSKKWSDVLKVGRSLSPSPR